MEGRQLCEDHPNKLLTLQCVPCDKLICVSCKQTGHTFHVTRNIRKAAEDIRYQLLTKLHDLKGPTTNARAAVKKKRSSHKSFEESVQETKQAIRDRAENVISSYINQVVLEKLQSVDDFAERNGRTELCSHVSELEEHLNALKTNEQAIKRLLANDVSDLEVIQQWPFVSTPPTPPVFAIPVHQTYLFLPKINDQWKDQIQSMFGLPKVAQTSTQSSVMAVAHRLNVLNTVQALHVMNDGRLCVALVPAALPENSAVHDSLVLHVYNQDGTLFLRKTIEGCKRPRLSSTPNGKIVVLCAFSGTKTIFDVGPWASETEQTDALCDFLCCFKMDSHKIARRKLSTKTKKRTIYEVGSESTKPLFTILTENPQTVVADKAGEYFAVIQLTVTPKTSDTPKKAPVVKRAPNTSDTPKKAAALKRAPNTSDTPTKAEAPLKQMFQGSVAVFKRPSESTSKAQKPFTIFSPQADKDSYPAAVCFDKNSSNQNVLLVAQGAAIYMVDYENTGNPITPVTGECPVLTTPTALTTDSAGRLWIGCQDGSILNWVHMEELLEHYYMQPEDGDVSSDSEDGVGASAPTSTTVHITSSPEDTQTATTLKRNRLGSGNYVYVDAKSLTQSPNSSVNGESDSDSVLQTPVEEKESKPSSENTSFNSDTDEYIGCLTPKINVSPEGETTDGPDVTAKSKRTRKGLYTDCRSSNSRGEETTDRSETTNSSKPSEITLDLHSKNHATADSAQPESTAKKANVHAEEIRKAATAQRDEEAPSMNVNGSKEFNRKEDDSESSVPGSDTMSKGTTTPHSDGSKTASQNPPSKPVPPPPRPPPRHPAYRPCPLPPGDEFSSQTTADLTGEHTQDKHRQVKPLTGCGDAESKPRPPPPPPPKPRRAASMENLLDKTN